jgi:hypothetical protein
MDSVLYWRLKELEKENWSGTVFFVKEKKAIGRIFLNKGYISWADATGQKISLVAALHKLADINKDDLNFAQTMYKDQKGKASFVSIMEDIGLVGFWTLRECLRIQIHSAIDWYSEENCNFVEKADKIASPSTHNFTLDELFLTINLENEIDKNFLRDNTDIIKGFHVYGNNESIFKKSSVDYIVNDNAKILFDNLAKSTLSEKNDLEIPPVVCFDFDSGVLLFKRLKDIFETTVVLEINPNTEFQKIMEFLSYYPTLLLTLFEKTS